MKYIIEIEDEPMIASAIGQEVGELYKAKGFKSLVFDVVGLSKLKPLKPYKSTEEVWEFATNLLTMHPDVAEAIFWSLNDGKGLEVAAKMSYEKAKAAYDKWEENHRNFKIGDEVRYRNGGLQKFVVTNYDERTKMLKGICTYSENKSNYIGGWDNCLKKDAVKTGRFMSQIAAVIEEAQNDN